VLEFPAGAVSDGEQAEAAALRELEEETVHPHPNGAAPDGAYYFLPSETNKYTHVFLASPVVPAGDAAGTPRSRSTST
jgi:8-oxo-dGTP pyrophosphatase MutT (NUDIX family)